MKRSLEFYFDFSSPYAYLASTQVNALAARTGADLRWRPMLLGAVFKAIGTPNVPLLEASVAKRRMYLQDMARWADHYGVSMIMPTGFPMNTVQALRVFLALEAAEPSGCHPGESSAVRFGQAAFHAFWALDRDLQDEGVLRELISDAGADTNQIMTAIGSPEIKTALRLNTEEAVARGIFGAPALIVDQKHLFWGQDRLEMVEKVLLGWEPAL